MNFEIINITYLCRYEFQVVMIPSIREVDGLGIWQLVINCLA